MALHPDKNLVAMAQIGKEPFVCVWDSSSLETVSILQGGHERGTTALAFSNQGNVRLGWCCIKYSVPYSSNFVCNTERAFSPYNKRLVLLHDLHLLQRVLTSSYCYLSFQHLASVGLDDHHTLNIWDWRRGKVVASTRGHSDRIFDIQLTPTLPRSS